MEDASREDDWEEKPGVSKNDPAAQSDENTLDSSINRRNYDVLRIVFRYLNGRDLAKATMICKFCLEIANDEKLRRGPCYCLINRKENMDLLSYIKNIRIKPLAAFFFIPFISNYNIEKLSIKAGIQDLLSKHCKVIMLHTPETFIIANNDSETQFDSDNIIGTFLPQIPNVRIEAYEVTKHYNIEWDTINANVSRETFKSNHETSTSFIFFTNYTGSIRAINFISYMQKRKTFKISSLLNIVVADIYVPNKTNRRIDQRMDEPNCIAVMITGPIKTWSVILEKNCNTQEHIEARLKLFKDEIKLKTHSLGFMFSSCLDSYIFPSPIIKEKINIVVTIFKRLFPEISRLVGCLIENLIDYGNVGTTDEINKKKYKVFKYKSGINVDTDFDIMFLILTYD